jgi:hypothetical protein
MLIEFTSLVTNVPGLVRADKIIAIMSCGDAGCQVFCEGFDFGSSDAFEPLVKNWRKALGLTHDA